MAPGGRYPRPGTAPWPLVETGATDIDPDLCCCRTTDPDMALGGRMGQGNSVASRDSISCFHQAVPHCPCISSSASLHCAQVILFLFLYRFSMCMLIKVVPTPPVLHDYRQGYLGCLLPYLRCVTVGGGLFRVSPAGPTPQGCGWEHLRCPLPL